MENIFEDFMNSIKYVSDNSQYVKINYEKLDEIIANNDFEEVSGWLDSNPFGLMEMSERDVINFLLIYHTIGDYCFWGNPKWEIETDVGKLDGSYAIIYLLIQRYKKNKDFNMKLLSFSTMLDGNVEIPLLQERFECLGKMNQYLSKIKGDFYDEVKDLNDDVSLFNYLISNLDYLNDVCFYKDKKVSFYKRAQFMTSNILHAKKLLEGNEVDYSNLIGCADYKIPQVMRCLGVLEFKQELADLVDNGVELEYGSEMEVEIRANNLIVIDYIYKKLEGQIARIDINDYIWFLGQDKCKMIKPYHKTRTIYY